MGRGRVDRRSSCSRRRRALLGLSAYHKPPARASWIPPNFQPFTWASIWLIPKAFGFRHGPPSESYPKRLGLSTGARLVHIQSLWFRHGPPSGSYPQPLGLSMGRHRGHTQSLWFWHGSPSGAFSGASSGFLGDLLKQS